MGENLFQKLTNKIKEAREHFIDSRHERTFNKLMDSFHKTINVSQHATLAEINQKTIEYVKNNKDFSSLLSVILTDEQYSDREFLLELYKANPILTVLRQPRTNLETDSDFMIQYVKIMLQGYHENPIGGREYSLEECLSKAIFTKVLRKADFLEKLSKEFPEENIAQYLYKIKFDLYEYPPQNRVEKICSQLSNEFFQAQVSRFGKNALKYFPTKIASNVDLITLGVGCDGFDSLRYLNVQDILDNKALILLAAERDGAQALANYINKTLSPNRTSSYMCHGEPHLDHYFDKRYNSVQDALLADPEIQAIFEKFKHEQTKTGYIKTQNDNKSLTTTEDADISINN